jgi:hypothetical protein
MIIETRINICGLSKNGTRPNVRAMKGNPQVRILWPPYLSNKKPAIQDPAIYEKARVGKMRLTSPREEFVCSTSFNREGPKIAPDIPI